MKKLIQKIAKEYNVPLTFLKGKLLKSSKREFQDKVCWYNVCRYYVLSEEFIREFQDEVNWELISINQRLSEEFYCFWR